VIFIDILSLLFLSEPNSLHIAYYLGGGKDLEVNGVLGSGFWVQGSGFSAASGRERSVKSKTKLMNIERSTSNKVFYHFTKLTEQA
jgi:hypothetical protein